MAMRVRSDRYGYCTAVISEHLFPASQLLSEIVGFPVQPNKAIVGRNAFAHEAGIHQDGMIKNSLTYEIMTPQSVGVPRTNFVLGKHSGRNALSQHCKDLGFHLNRRELDHVYRQLLAIADVAKKVEDGSILEIIHATRHGESGNDISGPLQHRIALGDPERHSIAQGAGASSPHQNEQQEDYLWGV